MVVEPRLHFDEGLERLTQFRLTDGMDVVILVLAGLPKPGEAGPLLSTFISLPLNNASFSATRFPLAS
jgi:hypothetical protein